MGKVMVCKDTKVNGKAQRWTVLRQRPNVSATVWEPIAGLSSYRTASLARSAANVSLRLDGPVVFSPPFPVRWTRRQGRGSANWIAIERDA